jgi:hypothetical protein
MEDTVMDDNLDYEYYSDQVKKNYSELFDYIDSKPEFNIEFSNKFYELNNKYCSSIQDLIEVLERDNIYDRYEIIDEVTKSKKMVYKLLNKHYNNILLSEKGFVVLEESGLLNIINIYYNLYASTSNLDYIIIGLKYSSFEILEIIDDFLDKNHDNYNSFSDNTRYKNYINIIYKIYKKNNILDLDMIILIGKVKKICERNSDYEIYFKNIFAEELRMIEDAWPKLKEYFE